MKKSVARAIYGVSINPFGLVARKNGAGRTHAVPERAGEIAGRPITLARLPSRAARWNPDVVGVGNSEFYGNLFSVLRVNPLSQQIANLRRQQCKRFCRCMVVSCLYRNFCGIHSLSVLCYPLLFRIVGWGLACFHRSCCLSKDGFRILYSIVSALARPPKEVVGERGRDQKPLPEKYVVGLFFVEATHESVLKCRADTNESWPERREHWPDASNFAMSMIRCASFLFAILPLQALAQNTAQDPAPYLREAVVTETAATVRITANSPRPLLQIVEALQRKYGWVIGYEDPRYIARLDVVALPGGESQPAGGVFKVEFAASAPQQENVLRQVLDSYNESKNPGRFELRRTGDGEFYIAGVGARNAMGAISAQHPLLDLPLTVDARERTITETINLICRQIALKSHIKITLGVSPASLLMYNTAKIGGTKMPARDLLLQCMRATHRNLYWRLLFNPTSKSYFLDIHSAHPV